MEFGSRGTAAAIGGKRRAAAASCDNGSGSGAMGSSSSPLLSYIFAIRSWRSISVLKRKLHHAVFTSQYNGLTGEYYN